MAITEKIMDIVPITINILFFDKNYKNFTDNSINYNTVYDAEYKNIL